MGIVSTGSACRGGVLCSPAPVGGTVREAGKAYSPCLLPRWGSACPCGSGWAKRGGRAVRHPRERVVRARRSATESEAGALRYEVSGDPAASRALRRRGPVPQTGQRVMSTPVSRLIRSGTDSAGRGASAGERRPLSTSRHRASFAVRWRLANRP
jgi:hypothetical protein